MFLSVIGNSHRRKRIAINVLFIFLIVGLIVLGVFTIKKRTYLTLNSWELAQEIAENATELAMENGTTNIDFATVLWSVGVELVNTVKVLDGPPKRDFLMIVNIFIGVDDDVHDKYSWYVVIFSFVGALLYGWNVLRFVLWIDHKVEEFLDDMSIYKNVADQNEFSDFVLDIRKKKALEGEMFQIQSLQTANQQYDIKEAWNSLTKRTMKAFLPISPALLYLSAYAFSLFLLSCYHTWMRKPNELVDNMRTVANFAAGLESSILAGNKRDLNSYVFILAGIPIQILFFLTCYRIPEMIVRVYCAIVGHEDTVRPAYLDSIREVEKDVNKAKLAVEPKKID
ncbi:hypothetical protein L5515_003232 [Caenorhabditis briggsae]|uniref:Uncharacterized protein n=1 Tax=Caenorhabditis briggsae TaxID=6238 RepID=A0AAE9EIN3_CAEBR|nr:hypothetical protein L5515_003232 [Caenorhabditis briggsae]